MQSRISREPSAYITQLWLDSIAFNTRFLSSLVEHLGVDRFVLGSDYPVGGPAHPVADVRALSLGSDDESAVRRGNAERLLGGVLAGDAA
jgi:aminocarboxymuconate-semialdehyde decarboxylase